MLWMVLFQLFLVSFDISIYTKTLSSSSALGSAELKGEPSMSADPLPSRPILKCLGQLP